jgi:hypothetical protein
LVEFTLAREEFALKDRIGEGLEFKRVWSFSRPGSAASLAWSNRGGGVIFSSRGMFDKFKAVRSRECLLDELKAVRSRECLLDELKAVRSRETGRLLRLPATSAASWDLMSRERGRYTALSIDDRNDFGCHFGSLSSEADLRRGDSASTRSPSWRDVEHTCKVSQ